VGGLPRSSSEALRLVDVWKVYGRGVVALRGVSLALCSGELLVVYGMSGSGKSTLLRVACGIDSPTRGEVYLLGRRVGSLRQRELERVRLTQVGLVLQQWNLIPWLTALENIQLALYRAGVGDHRRRAMEALEAVGLGKLADRLPEEMSMGQRQVAALARALALRPKLLALDEPTANLDSTSAGAVYRVVREAADGGVAVLMVCNDPAGIKLADRRVELLDGALVGG